MPAPTRISARPKGELRDLGCSHVEDDGELSQTKAIVDRLAAELVSRRGGTLLSAIALVSLLESNLLLYAWLTGGVAAALSTLLWTGHTRTRAVRAFSGALLVLVMATVLWQAFTWTGTALAPSLLLLPLFGALATLLCGFWIGHAAFVTALLGHVAYCALRPAPEPADSSPWSGSWSTRARICEPTTEAMATPSSASSRTFSCA
jgi:hypothetical protein